MTELQASFIRGRQFLESQSVDGAYSCYVDFKQDRDVEAGAKLSPPESFSSAVIADLLKGDLASQKIVNSAVDYLATREKDNQFTFFEDPALCPPDADMTSLAYTALYSGGKTSQNTLHSAVNTILEATDEEGLIQVWLDPQGTRPNRKDPVVTANALHLFYTAQRSHDVGPNEVWLGDVLRSQKYLEGTRYYYSPDAFLHFFGRLAVDFPDLGKRHEGALRQALSQRIEATDHSIDISMRATLAHHLGMHAAANAEITKLVSLQVPEGYWPGDALYQGMERYFGSRALSTAFALKALQSVRSVIAKP